MRKKTQESAKLKLLLTRCCALLALSTPMARAGALGDEEEVFDYLKGIRFRNETVYEELKYASMAGGMEFFIEGAGFDDQAHINTVLFQSLQTDDLRLAGATADIDDQIQSAPRLGKLAYKLPSLPDLFGGIPMESFNQHYIANNGDENIRFEIITQNNADNTFMPCPDGEGSKCRVRYSVRYTPQLFDVSPNQVYLDEDLTFYINPFRANNNEVMKEDADPVDFIKFSGTRNDFEGKFDNSKRLSNYRVDDLPSRSGDQKPGRQIPEVRFRVGNALLRETAKHCNFAGDDCWYIKTHPKIDSVSASSGYTTGGQELIIRGWGLKGENGVEDVDITVDGVPCTVTSSTITEISCITGAADAVSNDGVSQPGSPGLTYRKKEISDWWSFRNDEHDVRETTLITGFETRKDSLYRDGVEASGWFKAPAAGRYRFYMACDDKCELTFDATNKFDKSAPVTPAPETIATRNWNSEWRHYFYPVDPESGHQYISDWVELEEGEFYKIDGYHMEWTGSDHFTVSVEYEMADSTGHHHARKEIQVLSIETDQIFEEFQITVEGATGGGKFKVQFFNPFYDPEDDDSKPFWISEEMSDDVNASTMQGHIDNFFQTYWGSNIHVVKVDYDANDVETEDADLVVKSVYTTTLRKLINGPSFTSAAILADPQDATFTITSQLVESAPPLAGKYKITCADENGSTFSTRDLTYDHWSEGTDFYVNLEIPHLQFKVYVRNVHVHEYMQNSVAFAMIFQDYHGDVPECICESSETVPITGQNVVYKSTVIQEYGENLFFEPAPLEMLYSDAEKPQVLITVNGIDAVCPGFDCDFVYVEAVGEITSQSLVDGAVTIQGTNLPVDDISITLSNSACEDIVATETEITCTLNVGAAAGEWDVKLVDVNGLTPVESAVEKLSVGLTVTEISPSTGLNQLGGDILTIMGTGFDQILDNTTVTFSDGTACDLITTRDTAITCMVSGFDPDALDSVNPYAVTVTVNSVVDENMTVAILDSKQSGQTVSPTTVSPVLASVLTVTLEETYPDALAVEDFTATLVSQADATQTRPLYVMSVDDSTKTIQIKFPGADSGSYYVQVHSATIGRIDKTPLAIEIISKITGISPMVGSTLGGTLLTIDGENFSDDPYDNPVKVGDNYCLVETTSPTQITCRIIETVRQLAEQAEVIVFLRTSEEAQSDVDTMFEYAHPLESLTTLDNRFDAATNTHIFTAECTRLTVDDLESVSLFIDGVKQETISVTDTVATFTVTEVLDETSSNVRLYFSNGLPQNYDSYGAATMTPTLVSISPSTGSSGGTLITVTAAAIGVNTADLNLAISSSGEEICETVSVTAYGTFTCLTKAMEITSADTIVLKTSSGTHACGNTIDASACVYEQLDAGSPTVTGVTISSASQVDILGTDFPTSDKDAIVIIQGVESSYCTINDSTSITAVFDNGIPVINSEATPSIRFVPTTSSERRRLVALTDADEQLIAFQSGILIQNALSVSDSTSGLTCSFQGGCSYTVTANGLTSTLKADETSYIEICGNKCILDEEASSAVDAVCTLPFVMTAYSAAEYDIVKEGVLHDGVWTGTADDTELAKLIDDKNTVDMIDADPNCYFQIQYKENHVGVLDEVKVFIDNLTDKSPYIANLVFQGSDDGSTFTDLWTLDASVHEGWNAHDFEENQPSFNIYRFQGSSSGACRVGEVRLHGVESIDNDDTSYTCTPKLFLQGVNTEEALNSVVFDSAVTPVLTGMSTRFGSVLGGEEVEFYGTNFSDSATTRVFIDDRECEVTSTTVDTITCTTDDKPYRPDEPSLVISIDGMGYVATRGKVFRYISRWSDPQTWNYDLSPQDGEAVNIPKGLHLLVDIDSSPKLSFLNVEGSLIFPPDSDPNHQRTFDAHYILVKGGYMEVGTEDNRYTSKLTITMHSSKYDPNLPIFGNKVIGVNYGELEMHGIERPVTWTDLFVTADVGATTITLNTVTGDPLDWAVGEEIVIASTDYSGRNAEQRTIETITDSDTNPVITFSEPLLYKHYAGVQYFGANNEDFIEMRAEVGLLTRNVKYQGDPETSADNQYGAVIIMHSPGDETTAARIDSIELYNVGQAFILGSYPIHFHMIGTVHSSYIRNNAIHHTFNRAVTIHGIHYLRVQNNVAYHTMGHTIFIEDAAETKNLIEGNLIVDVRRSWSLLNTDQTPASFWITNPDNIIRNNHAAGSDRYSYWYDTQKTAIGPSFDANICPENTKLGEFRDNVAHSNGRYGLRIFHNLIPREHPCEPMEYDPTDPNDPYPNNRPIIAEFHNLVSYKNGRNGAIAERVGAVQFHNFKTADNILAGMEFSLTEDIIDGYAKIVGGFVVGKSENTEQALENANPHGIIAPRTENFSIEGTNFYNYNWGEAAGLGSCSHCFHPAATDSGARTIRVSNLGFDETTTLRIRYGYPERAIFYDETGSLTDKGPGSWAVPDWPHLRQPECEVIEAMGGITCDNTVQVRRIAFYGYAPDHFWGMEMKIAQYDNNDVAEMKADGTLEAYLDSNDNYSQMIFKKSLKPINGWAVPYVTGHKYRVHWRRGLDFDRMQFEPSERWEPTDLNTFFNLNFTETREAVNFTTQFGDEELGSYQIFNESMVDQPTTMLQTGDNWILNDTETREINFVVNGKNPDRQQILMEGLRCISGKCELDLVEDAPIEADQRLWSNVTNWGGTLPQEGDDVEIPAGWNMLLDIEETPVFKSLTINGRLTFYNNNFDIHLRSKQIFVRAGELLIGTEEEPFKANALITLHGMQDEETLVLSGTVSAGNKILATVGDVKFFGQPRQQMTRLMYPVYTDDTEFFVEPGLDWVEGDEIHLAPTAMQYHHSDYVTIASYDDVNGKVVINEPLLWYHWGAPESTADDYNGVDMRGEVTLLTRNIKIRGEDADGWGGQVLVTDYFETDGTWRKGQIFFDNVQVYNCSQEDTYKAAIRWEGALGGASTVQNSVVHGSMGWSVSVLRSNNVHLTDSSFVGSRPIGVHTDFVRNFTLTNSFISDVMPRKFGAGDGLVDKEACVAMCSYMTNGSPCIDITVTNNIAAGCKFAGFIAPGHDCDDEESVRFKDNVSHSNKGVGAAIYPDGAVGKQHSSCYELSHFKAYKTTLPCVATHYKTFEMRAHHLTCIDSEKGINLQTGNDGDELLIKFSDSFIYGETDALDCPNVQTCYCPDKMGLMFFGNNVGSKDLHIAKKSPRPIYKVKSYGAYGGEAHIENVQFAKFDTNGRTKCQARQSIFARNPYASDKIPMHKFKNCKFVDVDDSSVAFFSDPDPGWAIIKDCGAFPCTAPNNILASFTGARFSGTTPARTDSSFQIIPDDPDVGGKVGGALAGCDKRDSWQGYYCRDRAIAYLTFESLDDDKFDRSIQPIFILNDDIGFNNTLNSMMDHVWDGFYTGQIRASRFPGLLSTDYDYTLDISGTPPKKMRFNLKADVGGVKIKIPYPVAGSVSVLANNKKIDYTPWSKELGRAEPLTKTFCGENRYVGIENFLEFYLTPACEIKIVPRDAIMTKVRMEWSLDEFYSNGGVTRFVDRLAASLGINANRIKTVAVYEGSTIVDFVIEEDEEATDSGTSAAEELAELTTKLVTQVNEGSLDIGSPILGLQGDDGTVLAGDPIPDPVGFEGTTTVTVETVETAAIIRDGPNLWDGIVPDAPVIEEPEVEEPEVEEPQEEEPVIEEPVVEEEPIVVPEPQPEEPTEEPIPAERPIKEVITKIIVYEEEEYEAQPQMATTSNDVSSVTVEDEAVDSNDAKKFLIVIPAIVVGLLIIVAISIIVKSCNKKRQRHIITIKEQMETDGNFEQEVQDHQFVMEADEKNIFSRPTSTPAGGKRVRIHVAKGKGGQDDLANGRVDNSEIDDGFNSMSMNSSKKFDLSSKSYHNDKTVGGNDTIRVLNEDQPSLRNVLQDNE